MFNFKIPHIADQDAIWGSVASLNPLTPMKHSRIFASQQFSTVKLPEILNKSTQQVSTGALFISLM